MVSSWMRRLLLVTCLVGLVLGGVAAGQGSQPAWATDTEEALSRIAAGHNAAVDTVDLGPAASLLADERVTLVVTDDDGSTALFAFRTDARLHVVDLGPGARGDETVRLFTDRATIERIADASDRSAAFESAVRAGDVRIEGIGIVNRTLWGLLGLALWALRSPLEAAALGAVSVVGLGAATVAAMKLLGGGTLAASGAAGTTGTASSSATGSDLRATTKTGSDPVGIADRILSFFERLLFIVAIVKGVARRLQRRLGRVGDRIRRTIGVRQALEEEVSQSVPEQSSTEKRRRRRSVPRRRRR